VAFVPIVDPADARLEDYRNVPDPELIERRGIFVAEGRLVVRRLLQANRFAVRSVLVTTAARRALENDDAFRLRAETASLPVYEVPPWVINAITGFNIHRGCLAIGERPVLPSWQQVTATAQRIIVAERVANADNVGAIFRNAAAFGADGVLLERTCTDPLYRKAIRTSMGAALQVPYARMEPWPAALHGLRDAGYTLLGMIPRAEQSLSSVASGFSRTIDSAKAGSRKIAIVVGHEGDGLSDEALAACTHLARIPMARGVDSLNVATASAIAMYECF
jgi:tRNA G18 (ribose-2'-O)-methylase SpoU